MTNPTPTVTRTWTCILFDLDGTLTDSAPGITASLVSTFETFGLPVPSLPDSSNTSGRRCSTRCSSSPV